MVLIVTVGLVLALYVAVTVCYRDEIASIRERDPAATGMLEIVLTYSGLHAIIIYRLANRLWQWRVPLLPRLCSQLGRALTGIEIHPGATIGRKLFIDHGMGVVIGETTVIGDSVTLYQGVTLGGTGKETGKRHPTIGNHVVVGAGAKVLGNISIGDNSYIGANAVVLKNVPTQATVVGVPGRLTRQDGRRIETSFDHVHVLDPLMQTIEQLQKRLRELERRAVGKQP